MRIPVVQMWLYGLLEITHLADNLEWLYWDCWRSSQILEARQRFICTFSLSLQVSCCLLSYPEFYIFLSRAEVILKFLDCICPLWETAMLRTKSAYNRVSYHLQMKNIFLSILTTGKPNSNEKSMRIPQLKKNSVKPLSEGSMSGPTDMQST